jgi:hypothetical protein
MTTEGAASRFAAARGRIRSAVATGPDQKIFLKLTLIIIYSLL